MRVTSSKFRDPSFELPKLRISKKEKRATNMIVVVDMSSASLEKLKLGHECIQSSIEAPLVPIATTAVQFSNGLLLCILLLR